MANDATATLSSGDKTMKEGAVTLGISLAILIRMSLSFILSFIHNRQFIVNGYYVTAAGGHDAPTAPKTKSGTKHDDPAERQDQTDRIETFKKTARTSGL
jgi:hypothetical protein